MPQHVPADDLQANDRGLCEHQDSNRPMQQPLDGTVRRFGMGRKPRMRFRSGQGPGHARIASSHRSTPSDT